MFNLRGDNGAVTGGLAVDSNLGWKGPEKYVAIVPQVFDLWQGPLELSKYQQFQWLREQLQKDGFNLALPTGN